MAVDDVRGPAQFAHRFQNTPCKEDGALVVVRNKLVFCVEPVTFFLK